MNLDNGFFSLSVSERGANVLSLRAGGQPVWRDTIGEEYASFVLLPYSNRIRDGRFSFEGREVVLFSPDECAIHGCARDNLWQLECEDNILTARLHRPADRRWPWSFAAELRHELRGHTCLISLSLTNKSNERMPAGMGIHPYFMIQKAQVSFAAAEVYDTDERLLPIAAARPVRPHEDYRQPRFISSYLDTGYRWEGTARLQWAEHALTMTADPIFSHLIVYTAPDGTLALEPVTHATNAFNLATRREEDVGFRVLEAGETMSGTISLTLTGDWGDE